MRPEHGNDRELVAGHAIVPVFDEPGPGFGARVLDAHAEIEAGAELVEAAVRVQKQRLVQAVVDVHQAQSAEAIDEQMVEGVAELRVDRSEAGDRVGCVVFSARRRAAADVGEIVVGLQAHHDAADLLVVSADHAAETAVPLDGPGLVPDPRDIDFLAVPAEPSLKSDYRTSPRERRGRSRRRFPGRQVGRLRGKDQDRDTTPQGPGNTPTYCLMLTPLTCGER